MIASLYQSGAAVAWGSALAMCFLDRILPISLQAFCRGPPPEASYGAIRTWSVGWPRPRGQARRATGLRAWGEPSKQLNNYGGPANSAYVVNRGFPNTLLVFTCNFACLSGNPSYILESEFFHNLLRLGQSPCHLLAEARSPLSRMEPLHIGNTESGRPRPLGEGQRHAGPRRTAADGPHTIRGETAFAKSVDEKGASCRETCLATVSYPLLARQAGR